MISTLPASAPNTSSNRFVALMDIYEQNYLLMRTLVPKLSKLPVGERVSNIEGCLSLYLSVLEQEKYTTTLNLSYRFREKSPYPKQPDLLIRVYHDANTAEVLSGLVHGQRYVQRETRTLHVSWQSNRFLYKWLRYCLHRGHGFVSIDSAGPNNPEHS